MTSRSILPSEKDQLTFLSLPGAAPVNVVEINAATGACPKGLQVNKNPLKPSLTLFQHKVF